MLTKNYFSTVKGRIQHVKIFLMFINPFSMPKFVRTMVINVIVSVKFDVHVKRFISMLSLQTQHILHGHKLYNEVIYFLFLKRKSQTLSIQTHTCSSKLKLLGRDCHPQHERGQSTKNYQKLSHVSKLFQLNITPLFKSKITSVMLPVLYS